MTDFLPKGTKIPSTSNYLKLQQGENTFRVLSPAIAGFEYFTAERKPIRSKTEPEGVPKDIGYQDVINKDTGLKEAKMNDIRYFWAFIIWNYKEERIQIAEFTQKTILVPLEALLNNGKWGDLRNYDITITRTGTTMSDTEYSIVPNPKEKLDPAIVAKYNAKGINLEALYSGADPFNVGTGNGMPAGVEYPKNDLDPIAF